MSDWQQIDWQALAQLRERFLKGEADGRDYWQSEALVRAYDLTFAQRIGWKWDAVMHQAKAVGWRPGAHITQVVDWACGSGVAARSVLEAFPDLLEVPFSFYDQSSTAAQYASTRMRQRFPSATASVSPRAPDGEALRNALVLISHAINELTLQQQQDLTAQLAGAGAVIWVEPGARAESQRLLVARDSLRATMHLWAPCPHQGACPLLQTESPDWCHHFGRAPVEAFTDPDWARFAQWMEVDLRSLPYSYFISDRTPPKTPLPPHSARIIGRPREYNGYMKVLSCEACGVQERILQKRDDKALYKKLAKAKTFDLEFWRLDADKIKGSIPCSSDWPPRNTAPNEHR